MRIRVLSFCCCIFAFAPFALAGVAEDLARIHIEAIGGRERLARLESIRAEGRTILEGQALRFVMWARRPNAVRIETKMADRVLTQGWDGVEAPWQQTVRAGQSKPAILLGEFEAQELEADAEFDDPLAAGAARGYGLDFAGETMLGERQVLKLLVTRNFTQQFTLYIDAMTYFIVRRDSTRRYPGGRVAKLVTRYDDFRPVAGVLMPHRIEVEVDGKPRHETVLETIEANPSLPAGFFSRPAGNP